MITRAKLIKNNKEWSNRADIPNQVGYKVLVCLNDGREIKTIVQKRQDGTHFLAGIDWHVVLWHEVFGWKPRG